MDRRTLIAVAICLALLLFYQPLMRRLGLGAYVDRGHPASTQTQRPADSLAGASGAPAAAPAAPAATASRLRRPPRARAGVPIAPAAAPA